MSTGIDAAARRGGSGGVAARGRARGAARARRAAARQPHGVYILAYRALPVRGTGDGVARVA